MSLNPLYSEPRYYWKWHAMACLNDTFVHGEPSMPCQLQNRKGILDQVVSPQRRENSWHGLVNQKWGTPRF